MTAAQLQKLKKRLEGMARELTSKGLAKIEPNRTSAGEVGSNEDEQPLNEMLQAIASNRNKNAEGVLARIDRALLRLREAPDDFGSCEECEEPIAAARLQAMPYAELCLECQAKQDAPKGKPTRRRLTDYS
jgi:DnaK suppressor protein